MSGKKDGGNDSTDTTMMLAGIALIGLLVLANAFLIDDFRRLGMTIGWAKAHVIAPVVRVWQDVAGCDAQTAARFIAREQAAGTPREVIQARVLQWRRDNPFTACLPRDGRPGDFFGDEVLALNPALIDHKVSQAFTRLWYRPEQLYQHLDPAFHSWIPSLDRIYRDAKSEEDFFRQINRALRERKVPTAMREAFAADLRAVREANLQALAKESGAIANNTGRFFVYFLYGPVLLGAWVWVNFLHQSGRFKRKLNLEMFAKFQSLGWHAIMPAIVKNPMEDKANLWRESLNPQEWVKDHGILVIDSVPDREGVREGFLKQLKSPWRGVKRLPPHRQALVAVFALQAARKIADCRVLLAALSEAWVTHGSVRAALSKDKALGKQVRGILSDNDLMGRIMEASRLHAYEETVLASMLEYCRLRGGVLASAEFLWLKPEDRGLWYIMNNVGRPTFHVECAGAIAHFKAEKASRRPLPEPDVDEAVFGLEEFFQRHVR